MAFFKSLHCRHSSAATFSDLENIVKAGGVDPLAPGELLIWQKDGETILLALDLYNRLIRVGDAYEPLSATVVEQHIYLRKEADPQQPGVTYVEQNIYLNKDAFLVTPYRTEVQQNIYLEKTVNQATSTITIVEQNLSIEKVFAGPPVAPTDVFNIDMGYDEPPGTRGLVGNVDMGYDQPGPGGFVGNIDMGFDPP